MQKITVYTLTTDNGDDISTQAYTSAKECDDDAAQFMQSYPDSYCNTDSHEIEVPTEPVNAGLLAAAKAAMMYIPESTMFYSDSDHGDRVYLKDMMQAAIAAAESPAPAETARPRGVPCCSECGSSDVKKDAWAVWDNNDWHVESTHDNSWCNACEGETSLDWKEA